MVRYSTFSVAHTDLSIQPFNNAQRTVRILVPNNIFGTGLRIKFSNYYSTTPVWVGDASIAQSNNRGDLELNTLQPVTVHGDTSFAIVPERDVYSDLINMTLKPGQVLAISLFYPQEAKICSGNFVGNFALRSIKGNYCRDGKIPQAALWTKLSHSVMPWDASSPVTTLSNVVVEGMDEHPTRVVAAFGDSIMQQGTWTTPFMLRLYQKYPGEISFCNLGIGGNRLLHPSPRRIGGLYGQAGIERIAYDLLPIEGLSHVIFCLGTNDLGLPGGRDGAKAHELITLKQYIDAVSSLASELHLRKVKLFVGTLLPREIDAVYTKEREELRLAINSWIKCSSIFDSVLDLAQAVADKDGVGMKKEFAQPDGLHPSIAGGKTIAESINLSLFAK